MAPMSMPGHHAFEGSKRGEPRKIPPQSNQKSSVTRIPKLSGAGSGNSTTSPRRRGESRVIHAARPS